MRTTLLSLVVAGAVAAGTGATVAAVPDEIPVAHLADAFAAATSSSPAQRSGWALLSGHASRASGSGANSVLPLPAEFRRLEPVSGEGGSVWIETEAPNSTTPDRRAVRWRRVDGRVVAEPGVEGTATADATECFAIAAYTVPRGGAGFHAITESSLRRAAKEPGKIDLRIFVRHATVPDEQQPPAAVMTSLSAGDWFEFDAFLGYLDSGDTLYVALGPEGDPAGDRTEIDFKVVRTPFIPVTDFPEDILDSTAIAAPGGWSVSAEVPVSPEARLLARGTRENNPFQITATAARVTLGPSGTAPAQTEARRPRPTGKPRTGHESIAAFRVPHSGYYALHDGWIASARGVVTAKLYVGGESAPRRILNVAPSAGRVSWNTEIGYVARGDVIHLAFANGDSVAGEPATAEFGGSIVEWAPRRAPVRVRRGADGWLDVHPSEAPRRVIDIPAAKWITVPAQTDDATEAIRQAFTTAQATRNGDDYVGVRLQAGSTYIIASHQVRGAVFALRDVQRLVFDGNGATLRVSSPELSRSEVTLFSVGACRDVVFANFTVEATSVPFTTGVVLDVSPRGANTQTVTFRVAPGALDPLRDISRDGQGSGYAYDPRIPGRLAPGAWTHYPGSGNPQIQPTGQPDVFTHRVTRTGNSIQPGAKWLVKNKRGGVIYLATRSGAENITLSGVTGNASGGGHLRFSQTSGINLLDCRFEPDGEQWISSSADSIHGRGREGVWIENTLIRGICEDVMNTYGQNMVVVADDDSNDALMSIRMFEGSVESRAGPSLRMPTAESVMPGDQLVFFNPQTGRVLGYAGVLAITNGRFTLTNPIPRVEHWEPGDDKGETMVYNTRVAGRFFVRDSRIMDSMRFGIYLKARGGVVFNSQFEGLSGPSVLAANEPEWPEGPPSTHLWVQGCTFSQNNHGYMPQHRAFMVVDPADISIYTRRLRSASEPSGYQAHLAREGFANSHVKLIGNVFHAWRGMGISVRNARNVRIDDNVFLPPVDDEIMRVTLAQDPALARDSHGAYAAIFLESVDGVRARGNQFHDLPRDDREIVTGRAVTGLSAAENWRTDAAHGRVAVSLSFSEWLGAFSAEGGRIGDEQDNVDLHGAVHRAGRLGAGLFFTGGRPAEVAASADMGVSGLRQYGITLWACPASVTDGEQVVFAQGDLGHGAVVAIARGRWTVGAWRDGRGTWLDLSPAISGLWQHVAFAFDATEQVFRGYMNGVELASAALPTSSRKENSIAGRAWFGGAGQATRISDGRVLPAGAAPYHGGVDEFRLIRGAMTPSEISALALRRSEPVQ